MEVDVILNKFSLNFHTVSNIRALFWDIFVFIQYTLDDNGKRVI